MDGRVPAGAAAEHTGGPGIDHPGLLPGLLTPRQGRSGAAPRRTARDIAVDALCVLLSAAAGLVWFIGPQSGGGPAAPEAAGAVLVAACAAMWWRRRVPVALAVVLIVASVWFPVVAGPSAIALFTVAVHRRAGTALAAAGLAVASAFAQFALDPALSGAVYWSASGTTALVCLLCVGWGLALRARRQLVVSLRERAVRAESEQRLIAERARRREREAIAREMHDTLAHRLARLSMAAGALGFRPDSPAEDIARGSEAIRENAHRSLVELRAIIGVLRATDAEDPLPEPRHGVTDLHALVAENHGSGQAVDFEHAIDGEPAPATAACLYRIVQEALTNARKHAPAQPVRVTVTGDAERGVRVEVRNAVAVAGRGALPVPGSGTGLIGLSERVRLASGRFEYGRTAAGEYRVWAWLPWAP
ncbi:sensor histidine kinase [Murinocardiopsis flavida]|uniref:sensor histidine kinase n=1 Tax=Murinocardiopsis flavida TaxID=645275 RepID=UPI001FE4D701|nr:histidine kinase [Murinocardiopsis flavida]